MKQNATEEKLNANRLIRLANSKVGLRGGPAIAATKTGRRVGMAARKIPAEMHCMDRQSVLD